MTLDVEEITRLAKDESRKILLELIKVGIRHNLSASEQVAFTMTVLLVSMSICVGFHFDEETAARKLKSMPEDIAELAKEIRASKENIGSILRRR